MALRYLFSLLEISLGRRRIVEAELLSFEQLGEGQEEMTWSVSHFPLMGCGAFFYPELPRTYDACNSLFTCDEIINPHLRFGYVFLLNFVTIREL